MSAPDCAITELERRQLVEWLEQALTEMDELPEFSQGSVDGLVQSLAILGVTYESDD